MILWIALTSNNLCGPYNWYEQDWDNTFGWSEVRALFFLKRFGVRVFDFWILSEPAHKSIKGVSVSDLTPNPVTDSDSRQNPKDWVKST